GIRRDDSKGIFAARNVRIVCGAARSDVNPIPIQAVELVSEANPLRIEKTKSCVLNFEGALGGFQLHRLADGHRSAVHQAGLDLEAWRRVVEGDSLGVDVGESIGSRKPKCAIFGYEPVRRV